MWQQLLWIAVLKPAASLLRATLVLASPLTMHWLKISKIVLTWRRWWMKSNVSHVVMMKLMIVLAFPRSFPSMEDLLQYGALRGSRVQNTLWILWWVTNVPYVHIMMHNHSVLMHVFDRTGPRHYVYIERRVQFLKINLFLSNERFIANGLFLRDVLLILILHWVHCDR